MGTIGFTSYLFTAQTHRSVFYIGFAKAVAREWRSKRQQPASDHRFIKRIMRRMLGFKAFHSASATLKGIEAAHMIRKGQFDNNRMTAFHPARSVIMSSVSPFSTNLKVCDRTHD